MAVTLRVGVKPEDGEIVEVGPYRHRVIWKPSTEPSSVLYCNNCGSSFFLKRNDGKEICAGCKVKMDGWD